MRTIKDKPENVKLGIKDRIFECIKDKELLPRFVKAKVSVIVVGHEFLAIVFKDPVIVIYEVRPDNFVAFNPESVKAPNHFVSFLLAAEHDDNVDSKDDIWDKYINMGEKLLCVIDWKGINTRFGIGDHIFASCNKEQRERFSRAFVDVFPDGREIWEVEFKNVFEPWDRMINEEKIKIESGVENE